MLYAYLIRLVLQQQRHVWLTCLLSCQSLTAKKLHKKPKPKKHSTDPHEEIAHYRTNNKMEIQHIDGQINEMTKIKTIIQVL